MLFIVVCLVVLFFYVLPLGEVVYLQSVHWIIVPEFVRTWQERLGVNLSFWFIMLVVLGLLYGLARVAVRFLEPLELDQTAGNWLNPLVETRGLRPIYIFMLLGIPAALAVLRIARRSSEPVVLLGLVILAGLISNLTKSVPVPAAFRAGKVPLNTDLGFPPVGPGVDDVTKVYRWRFNARPYLPTSVEEEFIVRLNISTERYSRMQKEPREMDRAKWDKYVVSPCPEVDVLSLRLTEMQLSRTYCTFDRAAHVLAFVQGCIQYAEDLSPDGQPIEYPKYPIESLMEERGDCEDHAILAAAILKRMGIDVALLFCPGHTALGVAGAEGLPGRYVEDARTGIKYFYGETSPEGWDIGEVPRGIQEYLDAGEFRIVPIVQRIMSPSSVSEEEQGDGSAA